MCVIVLSTISALAGWYLIKFTFKFEARTDKSCRKLYINVNLIAKWASDFELFAELITNL
jgi:hypothetical protein